jgi:hypothetical protein
MKHLTLRRIDSSLLVPSFASEYNKLLTHKRQQGHLLVFCHLSDSFWNRSYSGILCKKKCIVFPSLKSILTAATPLNVVVS